MKLRATWNARAGEPAEPVERLRLFSHLPELRSLDGLRRFNQLQFIGNVRGGPARWWRGEELHFDDVAALDRAVASAAWKEAWSGRFGSAITAPRFDLFAVDEEFIPPGSQPVPPDAEITALSGIWQVPADKLPAMVDPIYLDVHVPGVRVLPGLRCHTVMRALDWPRDQVARAHRAAEIRFDNREDFEQAFTSPAYDAVRNDGFNLSVAGPDVDIYLVEEEWRA